MPEFQPAENPELTMRILRPITGDLWRGQPRRAEFTLPAFPPPISRIAGKAGKRLLRHTGSFQQ
jgi:hypothetical protein